MLGPDKIASERRTRTLGLGACVRAFNDLAVPGMGNVYFGKQLLLALLGVYVAQQLRSEGKTVRNIETANAIEALACWLAFKENGWNSDRRLRGSTKLHGKSAPSFNEARKRSYYVIQPMRMATGQPLRELGLVEAESERFNAFQLTELGRDIIDVWCKESNDIFHWAKRGSISADNKKLPNKLTQTLSPVTPLPKDVSCLLREHVCRQDKRKNILEWVTRGWDEDISWSDWSEKPSEVGDEHWSDLHAGALFFETQEAAIKLLDTIENQIGNSGEAKFNLDADSEEVNKCIDKLRKCAKKFIEKGHDPTKGQAKEFCQECAIDKPAEIIRNMVRRDDRVLRLDVDAVIPGSAFSGLPGRQEIPDEADEAAGEENTSWFPYLPPYVSRRVHNMAILSFDMRRQFGAWQKENE